MGLMSRVRWLLAAALALVAFVATVQALRTYVAHQMTVGVLAVGALAVTLAVGLGMTAYGFAYFLFHDVIVHRRVSVRFRPANRYLQRIIKAHLVHHKTTEREGAVSFGFLWAPKSYGA